MDLSNYLKAGYPRLYTETYEPLRAIATIRTEGWRAHSGDFQRGIIERDTGKIRIAQGWKNGGKGK